MRVLLQGGSNDGRVIDVEPHIGDVIEMFKRGVRTSDVPEPTSQIERYVRADVTPEYRARVLDRHPKQPHAIYSLR